MKIIVAIDQTPNWKQITESVANRCWPENTEFKILSVFQPATWADFKTMGSTAALVELENMRKEHAEDILLQSREIILNAVPFAIVHTDMRQGSPRSQILDAAAEFMPDKIILGAHGHDENRLFPSTTSRSVAHHAQCTVELVRLKNEAVDLQSLSAVASGHSRQ